MKNGQTHFRKAGIVYGSMMMISVLLLFVTACRQEEKKQKPTLQALDTLQKGQPAKEAAGTKEAFPGGDSIQQNCQLIQGQAESLLEEYHQSKTTEARARQIIGELKKLELEWKQMDCQQVFGYMIPKLPSLTGAGRQVIR